MTPEDEEFEAIAKRQASYTGNGTAGRENMTAPTGFFFHMPKREWVGLTNDEITDCWEQIGRGLEKYATFAKAIEAKLKEKNT